MSALLSIRLIVDCQHIIGVGRMTSGGELVGEAGGGSGSEAGDGSGSKIFILLGILLSETFLQDLIKTDGLLSNNRSI
jgi:hypothetical protein